MSESKKALVAGSTGLVGRSLVQQLLEDRRYERVVALVRKKGAFAPHRKLVELQVDYETLEGAELPLDDSTDVYCALGTTIKKAQTQAAFRRVDCEYPLALAGLAKRSGARRFLIISSMGAATGSRFFYSRVKGETEMGLRQLDLPGLLIFRPSLLLGDRDTFRASERFAAVVMRALGGLMVGGLRKYRAIWAADVARAMIYAAHTEPPGVHVYESDRIQGLAGQAVRG